MTIEIQGTYTIQREAYGKTFHVEASAPLIAQEDGTYIAQARFLHIIDTKQDPHFLRYGLEGIAREILETVEKARVRTSGAPRVRGIHPYACEAFGTVAITQEEYEQIVAFEDTFRAEFQHLYEKRKQRREIEHALDDAEEQEEVAREEFIKAVRSRVDRAVIDELEAIKNTAEQHAESVQRRHSAMVQDINTLEQQLCDATALQY